MHRRKTKTPTIEPLEPRNLFSTYVVNTAADSIDSDPATTSLREAVTAANSNAGPDTIAFAPAVFPSNTTKTILLTRGVLQLTDTTGLTSIQGPVATALTINGNNAGRILQIDSNVSVDLRDLKLAGANRDIPNKGGAILSLGSLSVTHCSLDANKADYGSAIASLAGTLDIVNSHIGGNFSNAVHCENSVLNIRDSVFENNSVSGKGVEGGAFSCLNTPATVQGSVFRRNYAGYPGGGAIFIGGTGSLTASNSTFTDNSSFAYGGAIAGSNGTDIQLYNCDFLRNSALQGGALRGGSFTAVDCLFSENNATGEGGAIGATGFELALRGCTFVRNAAAREAGAIIASTETDTFVTNCTFTGNSAPMGGVLSTPVYQDTQSVTILSDCTMTGNVATVAGGAIESMAPRKTIMFNTIVAGNTAPSGPDLYGTIDASSSHNLIGILDSSSTGISPNTNGNLAGTPSSPLDPKLSPLASNGGPTQTIALLPTSPALNAGDNSLVPPNTLFDQRGPGFPRIVDTVDIGAFEFQNHLPIVDSISITPTAPHTNDTLTATVTSHDPDNDPLSLSYQWFKNGLPLSSQTSPTLNLSLPSLGDRGDIITLQVTPSDPLFTGLPLTSSSIEILNSAPVLDSLTLTPSRPGTKDTLTALVSAHDDDNDPISFTYQWFKNGQPLLGQTSSTLDLFAPKNGNNRDTITLQVIASDGSLSTTPLLSSPVTVGKDKDKPNR